MKFLLDENAHHGLIPFLSELGHDVVLSPKGLVNGDVMSMAIVEERALITHDSDFSVKMPPSTHPGIILIKIFPKYFDKIKNSFKTLLAQTTSPDLFRDKLFLIFEDRTDELPFTSQEYKFDE